VREGTETLSLTCRSCCTNGAFVRPPLGTQQSQSVFNVGVVGRDVRDGKYTLRVGAREKLRSNTRISSAAAPYFPSRSRALESRGASLFSRSRDRTTIRNASCFLLDVPRPPPSLLLVQYYYYAVV
jgi:hypothetical protein